MAIRLITGHLQQRSRYCAKQQQFFTENSMRYTLQYGLYSMAWTVVAGLALILGHCRCVG